jgi:hypothetical protein
MPRRALEELKNEVDSDAYETQEVRPRSWKAKRHLHDVRELLQLRLQAFQRTADGFHANDDLAGVLR